MNIGEVRERLFEKMNGLERPREVLRDALLRDLAKDIPRLSGEERSDFGRQLNDLKQELLREIESRESAIEDQMVEGIDVTAPFGVSRPDFSSRKPQLMTADHGTIHPLTREIAVISDIFARMGFDVIESRQLDDDYHMFTSLNFPPDHPARDNYDTFRTEENFIPPAHTSNMQNRIMRMGKKELENGGNIAAVSIGRVFRNEDIDATHEHTFHQYEGVFVSENATLGDLIGVLTAFFENYYGQSLRVKTQPGYFPFVEPGLEFAIEKPAILGGAGKGGEWLEMLGCGMIHPNVLREAGLDPSKYRGFAWGGGVERLVMLKYGIEDLRHFESGKLAFLREFR
jgi:phenylalanyl-tRNA synthetase alpha chain